MPAESSSPFAARLDLSPARWVWLPSERTLPGTFVLFRRPFTVHGDNEIVSVSGWILAESRYKLTVNGARVQWGPAPADPRTPEADPLDAVLDYLQPGANVLGVEVCHFGHGDGTHPLGKPGLILTLTLTYEDGVTETIATGDEGEWACKVDRAHPPGRAKRWYLRALQEVFDARLHPHGWDTVGFAGGGDWRAPMVLAGSRANQPSLVSAYKDYSGDGGATEPEQTAIRPRAIPMLDEVLVPVTRFVATGRLCWNLDPDEWFDFRTPDSFVIWRDNKVAQEPASNVWVLPATTEGESVFLTLALGEEVVGFPQLTVNAAAGTIIELMPHEAHDPDKTLWCESQFFNWSRFVCADGENRVAPFEYEALRFLQIHVRNAARPVTVSDVSVLRRRFPWHNEPHFTSSDPALNRLFAASVNMMNCALHETLVDGMARERQQYSGDLGHALQFVRAAFGDDRLPARFLNTWSQGITMDGYFLDAWPAYDRLNRVVQRQVGFTQWGPLLDHGVGFMFDCWHHWNETGDGEAIAAPLKRLKQFVEYLEDLRHRQGSSRLPTLLPVEDLGVPTVWIDHTAYLKQRHKRCAWNLYVIAALKNAMMPLLKDWSFHSHLADTISRATLYAFWDAEQKLFVVNLPVLKAGTETEPRLCDRSLATALLYDLCPAGETAACLKALAGNDPRMGRSYPANVVWNVWALIRHGRMDVVLRDMRERWVAMPSVALNNTLSEFWNPETDGTNEWSHLPVAPLAAIYHGLAGVSFLEPGGAALAVRPQPGDLEHYDVTYHTARGAVQVSLVDGIVSVTLPPGGSERDELHLPLGAGMPAGLPVLSDNVALGYRRYGVAAGATVRFAV